MSTNQVDQLAATIAAESLHISSVDRVLPGELGLTLKLSRPGFLAPGIKLRRVVEVMSSHEYDILKNARFPPRIVALPHVMEAIARWALTPKESVEEAAKMNDVGWLRELLHRFKVNVAVAAKLAAANGNTESIILLTPQIINQEEATDELRSDPSKKVRRAWEVLQNTAAVAAANDHLPLVKILFSTMNTLETEDKNFWFEDAVALVLEEAAANGHENVVRFAMDFTINGHYALGQFSVRDKCLTRAISGGFSNIVHQLLDPSRFYLMGMAKAAIETFSDAVTRKKPDIAELVYQIYPKFVVGFEGETFSSDALFIALSRDGNVCAIKHLYINGHDGIELIGEAFKVAARHGKVNLMMFLWSTGRVVPTNVNAAFEAASTQGQIEIMDILLNTGLISMNSFDTAFETVVRSGTHETFEFLYNKRRASPAVVQRGFETTTNSSIMKFLYKNERISTDSVSKAFQNACDLPSDIWHTRERCQLVECLCRTGLVSTELIEKGFEKAAIQGCAGVVGVLWAWVSFEMISKVFVGAANNGHVDVVGVLSNTSGVSRKLLIETFVDAVNQGQLKMLSRLSGNPYLPSDLIPQAFLFAARKGKCEVVTLFLDSDMISQMVVSEAFSKAAKRGHEDVVTTLLYKLRPAETTIHDGFISAARKGHKGVVKCIIRRVHCPSDIVNEAFITAARRGHRRVVLTLLYKLSIAETTIHDGFISAARKGHIRVVKCIIHRVHCPSDVVIKALKATTSRELQMYLYKK